MVQFPGDPLTLLSKLSTLMKQRLSVSPAVAKNLFIFVNHQIWISSIWSYNHLQKLDFSVFKCQEAIRNHATVDLSQKTRFSNCFKHISVCWSYIADKQRPDVGEPKSCKCQLHYSNSCVGNMCESSFSFFYFTISVTALYVLAFWCSRWFYRRTTLLVLTLLVSSALISLHSSWGWVCEDIYTLDFFPILCSEWRTSFYFNSVPADSCETHQPTFQSNLLANHLIIHAKMGDET